MVELYYNTGPFGCVGSHKCVGKCCLCVELVGRELHGGLRAAPDSLSHTERDYRYTRVAYGRGAAFGRASRNVGTCGTYTSEQ